MNNLQEKIKLIRKKKNYTTNSNQIFMLLTEELGEVAKELKNEWSDLYDEFNQERLSEEIADVLISLIALANCYNINVTESALLKLEKIKKTVHNKVYK